MSKHLCITVIAILLCISKNIVICYPSDLGEWVIEVNNYVLYNLVKNSNFQYHQRECSHAVLETLCKDSGVNLEFVDIEGAISKLTSKVKRLVPTC